MPNFDNKPPDSDLEFTIGGETFQAILPKWDVGTEFLDLYVSPPSENGNAEVKEEIVKAPYRKDIELAIEVILKFLASDDHKRFKALLGRKEDPITRQQIYELYNWIWRKGLGLPPMMPSGSSPGGDTTGSPSSSSDAMSSAEAEQKTSA